MNLLLNPTHQVYHILCLAARGTARKISIPNLNDLNNLRIGCAKNFAKKFSRDTVWRGDGGSGGFGFWGGGGCGRGYDEPQ